jgi:hypothetical protein
LTRGGKVIFDDGLRIYEFSRPHKLRGTGTVLDFPSGEVVFDWLKRLHFRRADFIFALRTLVDRYPPSADGRLSDEEVLMEAACLVRSRRLIVCVQERKIPQGSAPAAPETRNPVPFPLPKTRAQAPPPAQPAQDEPATFSPDIDYRSQAAVLTAAANSGTPFCPE